MSTTTRQAARLRQAPAVGSIPEPPSLGKEFSIGGTKGSVLPEVFARYDEKLTKWKQGVADVLHRMAGTLESRLTNALSESGTEIRQGWVRYQWTVPPSVYVTGNSQLTLLGAAGRVITLVPLSGTTGHYIVVRPAALVAGVDTGVLRVTLQPRLLTNSFPNARQLIRRTGALEYVVWLEEPETGATVMPEFIYAEII